MFDDDAPPSLFPGVPAGVTEDPQFSKKYELERQLGLGGAGVVYCARHRELDERVAIKFLLSGSETPEIVARFRREARAAHRVKSEHVVRIVNVSTTLGGVPYVVMEYLEGTDLERMLLESPDTQLPVRDAIEFVLQACEALAECHGIGIVHRDLKPSNLFCTYGVDGFPLIKVLDFGISKLGPTTLDDAMTGRHAIMGSPRYMSPEQFANPGEVDRRTDIWALGVIMYELVTGQAPFAGNTLIGIWESVKRDVPKALEELRRDVPRGLNAIVSRCLEKEPGNRYQNVAELAKALLPLSPERSRSSVARIVRIVEAPGVSTESLSLPPSGRPSTGGATSRSVNSTASAPRSSRNLLLGLGVAAAAIGVVVYAQQWQSPASDAVAPPPAPPMVTQPPQPATALAPWEPSAPEAPAPRVPPTAPASASPSATPTAVAPGPTPARATLTPSTASVVSANASARGTAPVQPTAPSTARAAAPPRAAPIASAASGAAAEPRPVTSSAASLPEPSSSAKSSPWVVDIVEQRKGKAGGSP